MKVSIIVPTYNDERHLERCIASLKNQTYSNLEIIIVNDGSTDDTLNLVTYHSELDPRIIIIDQKNSGTHLARLNGVKHSTGEAILNVDSDDYLELNAVELLVNKMSSTNADIVIANYYQHRNGGKRLMKNTIPSIDDQVRAIKYMLLGEISIYIWGRLFKKHLWENIDLSIERAYSEDVLTNFYILCNYKVKLALVEQPVLNYVIHDSNISYSIKQEPVEGFFNEFEIVEKMFIQKNFISDILQELALYKSIIWIVYCRKGGLKSKDAEYHRDFYRQNYHLAKKNLSFYLKLEMYAYSKNLMMGKIITNMILNIKSFIKI